MQAIINDTGAQVVDKFSDSSRVPELLHEELLNLGLWDNFRKTVLGAEDKKTAEAAWQTILADIQAKSTHVEIAPIMDKTTLMLVDEGVLSHEAGILFDQRLEALRQQTSVSSSVFWDNVGDIPSSQTVKILEKNKVPVQMGDWGNIVVDGRPVREHADEILKTTNHIYDVEAKRASAEELFAI
jgi:hypothetical protein